MAAGGGRWVQREAFDLTDRPEERAGGPRDGSRWREPPVCTRKRSCVPAGTLEHPTMPSTHLSLHYHLVFSTKNRAEWFPAPLRSRVHEFIGGVLRAEGAMPHAVGGTGDHIHIFAGLKATHCLADVMRVVKSVSSKWIHEELLHEGFSWQEGYGAFTVSARDKEMVRGYVLNQERHHEQQTYQEEYLTLLRRGLVAFDDRYLW